MEVVRATPDRPCIIYGDRIYTFKETNERVNAMANAFLGMGIKKGDKIAAGLYNSPQILETWYAAFKIGAVGVNIDYRLVGNEIQQILEDSDARVLVLDRDLIETARSMRSKLSKLEYYIVVGKKTEEMLDYETLIDKYPKTEPKIDWEVEPKDLAMLLYTGGTTGLPKGVMHTHESNLGVEDSFVISGIAMGAVKTITESDKYKDVIDGMLESAVKMLPITIPKSLISAIARIAKMDLIRTILSRSSIQKFIEDMGYAVWRRPAIVSTLLRFVPVKHCIPIPLIHGAAWYGGGGLCPISGITLVLLPSKHFDARELLEMTERYKINMWGIVGGKFTKMILDVPNLDAYDLSSLIMVGSTAAPWNPEMKAKLHELLPAVIFTDHLGLSENPSISTGVYFKGDDYSKVGTGDMEAKVVDEEGKPVKPGETGTIIARGAGGLGYYKNPEKSKETWLGDGWVSSGDMGTVDEKGKIIVYGRGSEVINSAGKKIWAEEVEEVIETHPKIEDLVVVGVPDPEWGESVMVVIKLKEGKEATKEEIIDYCRDKIASFKKPRYAEFVEELPLLPFGKIRRGIVKDMYRDYLARR